MGRKIYQDVFKEVSILKKNKAQLKLYIKDGWSIFYEGKYGFTLRKTIEKNDRRTILPANYVNYERIENLTLMDTSVDFSSKALKLSEETGEVSQAVLKYIGSNNVSKSANVSNPKFLVLEELCDVINVAVDMINSLDVTEQEVIDMFERKLDKWESKVKNYVNTNLKQKNIV